VYTDGHRPIDLDTGGVPPSAAADADPVWVPPPVARLGPAALPSEPPPLPQFLPEPTPGQAPGRAGALPGIVLFAAACIAVSYSEWRAGAGPLPGSSEAIVAAESPTTDAAPDASGTWPDPLVSLYETRADAARPIKLKYSIIDPRKAASRVRPAKPKPVGRVVEAAPAPPLLRWPSRPATVPPVVASLPPPRPAATVVTPRQPATTVTPRPTPAPPPVDARVAAAETRAVPPPPVATAAVRAEPAGEEERIRTTLTRFRTAYSRLDASAAREVWPSVDMRALERAFDGLKSQELRFDRCSLAVDGLRARAACTGRAVYVPRIGNQSPRSTSREWTFELKKADDERWTIASARSS
jgi:hypothetical protein